MAKRFALPRLVLALGLCLAAWLLEQAFLTAPGTPVLRPSRGTIGRGRQLSVVTRFASDLSSKTVKELKELLKEAGLPVSGKKADLIARLEENGGAEEEEEEEAPAPAPKTKKKAAAKKAPAPAPKKAPAKKKAAKKGGSIFEIDEPVDGFYEDDDEQTWYPGKVKKDLGGGKFLVAWDDESGEYECGPGYIRKRISEVDRDGPILPGEAVEALSDGEWFAGIVQSDNGDGTYTLIWDEDGEEATVNEEDMKKTVPLLELEELTMGQKIKGVITSIREFGAFCNIGAVRDGLIHVSNMKPVAEDHPPFVEGDRIEALYREEEEWYSATVDKVKKGGKYTIIWDEDGDEPYESVEKEMKLQSQRLSVKENEVVEVWVSKIDDGKLGLSMYEGGGRGPGRAARKPMDLTAFTGIDPNTWLDGEVVSIMHFGAFVKVTSEDGTEGQGLVHVSRMREGFVEDPWSEVEVGQTVSVRVENVDLDTGRMGLSMK